MFKPNILKIFASSPIKPIQQHMHKVEDTVNKLNDFMRAVVQQDWPVAAKLQGEIEQLESEADKIKQEIRMHLPDNLFMPVPRADILELLKTQDNIPGLAEDISGLIIGRNMRFPESIVPKLVVFVDMCIDASLQAQQAINRLDELLETGFSGKEAEEVGRMILRIDEIERGTDKQQIEIRAELFQIETHYPAVEMMFIYKVIELIGGIADVARRLGHQLEMMLAR